MTNKEKILDSIDNGYDTELRIMDSPENSNITLREVQKILARLVEEGMAQTTKHQTYGGIMYVRDGKFVTEDTYWLTPDGREAWAQIPEIKEKRSTRHDEKTIKLLIDFAEGKLDMSGFKHEFETNPMIKQVLINDPLYPRNIPYSEYFETRPKNIADYLEKKGWTKRGEELNTWDAITRFLSRYDYIFKPTKYYEDRYVFLLDIQPSWLDVRVNEEDFLVENVINKIPETLKTKAEKVKWCKEKIKEFFKYDKAPPRWIQNADWPIVNGKPLVFKGQSKEKKDDERVCFYFYDPETGKETIIEQFY